MNVELRQLRSLVAIADAGYEYDSSVGPLFRRFAAEPWRRFAHRHIAAGSERALWEFPISTVQLFGLSIPISGGNYFRQFPHALVKRAVEHWDRVHDSPFMMYFHTWELDPEQPRINASSTRARVRNSASSARPPEPGPGPVEPS